MSESLANWAQYQGDGDEHVLDYLLKLGRKVPYFVRQDKLTKQTVIVFPMKASAPGTIQVYTEADGYRQFKDLERFKPHTLTLRVAVVENALKVPGDHPAYERFRSEAS